jgi:Xaa-Pro aminopeptidase
MNELGLTALSGIDAVNVFREIRMVKSQPEIDVMRRAALANEAALDEAVGGVREGDDLGTIEDSYMAAMARQGGRGVYVLSGPGGLRDGRVRRGEPVMFDALGTFRHYHGDLARSAVVGEPDRETARRYAAMRSGWEAALEQAHPGVPFRQLSFNVAETVRRSGFPEFVFVNVHSIGLEHTDHPMPHGALLPQDLPELKLEEDMVITLALPFHEIGWGALHLEDSLLITGDVPQPLTSNRHDLIIL